METGFFNDGVGYSITSNYLNVYNMYMMVYNKYYLTDEIWDKIGDIRNECRWDSEQRLDSILALANQLKPNQTCDLNKRNMHKIGVP